MSKFESHLLEIDGKINTIELASQFYISDFKIVRDYVFDRMCKVDAYFKTIFNGFKLFGSYRHNIRINLNNQFDVIMELKFPCFDLINERAAWRRPGFVHLDFSYYLPCMEFTASFNGQHDFADVDEDLLEFLSEQLIDKKTQFLDRTKFTKWLNKVFLKALSKNGNEVIGRNGAIYSLSYAWRYFRFIVTAKSWDRMFSIDFVPGVKYFANDKQLWLAVPKRFSGPRKSSNFTFFICNPDAEANLLNSIPNQKIKIVLRLLQSLRTEKDMPKLHCYFLLTACLWEIKHQHPTFWNNSISFILLHMISELRNYFQKGFLPFYWDIELNLLTSFSDSEIEHYENILNGCMQILSTYQHQRHLTYRRTASHFHVVD